MKKIYCLLALSTAFSTMAFAGSYSGKLVDLTCYDKQQSSVGCDASGLTKTFALEVSGKLYKLDDKGNEKAAAALKNRADQSADPTKPLSPTVIAKIEGTESGGTIMIDTIEVQ
jgi:hypothetical protein